MFNRRTVLLGKGVAEFAPLGSSLKIRLARNGGVYGAEYSGGAVTAFTLICYGDQQFELHDSAVVIRTRDTITVDGEEVL